MCILLVRHENYTPIKRDARKLLGNVNLTHELTFDVNKVSLYYGRTCLIQDRKGKKNVDSYFIFFVRRGMNLTSLVSRKL